MIGLSFQTQKEFMDVKAKVWKETFLLLQDDTSVQHCVELFEAQAFWSEGNFVLSVQIFLSQTNITMFMKEHDIYKRI